MQDKRMWMVRAGRNAIIIDEFLNKNLVAIGWVDLGDLSNIRTKSELVERLKNITLIGQQGKSL